MERDAAMAQMDEVGVGCQVQESGGLRQQQQRRRGGQPGVGQRHDGADCAGLGRLPIGILIGRGVLACLLDRRRGLRDKPMEVSECQRKLDRQRK